MYMVKTAHRNYSPLAKNTFLACLTQTCRLPYHGSSNSRQNVSAVTNFAYAVPKVYNKLTSDSPSVFIYSVTSIDLISQSPG